MKGEALPEEAADITIDRLAQKISQNEPIENLKKYSFGIARLVFLERLRRYDKEKNAAETFYSQNGFHQHPDENAAHELFRECFEQLAEDEKNLLKEYFADLPFAELSRHREELSRALGISLNRLRLNVFRLRGRLESCLAKKSREK